MKKDVLIKEMREAAGSSRFITRSVLCAFFGISRNTCKNWLKGVDAINGKLYYIPEVADAVLNVSVSSSEEVEVSE